MNTKYVFDTADAEGRGIVYVRAVAVRDLPEEVRSQVSGADQLYAVHNSETGERLALVSNRQLAFALARQNDLAPVNVH